MYTVALLFRADETSIFLKKYSLLVYGLYIGIWNWFIYVPIALLLVVTRVIYLKQVRSKQF